MKKPASGRRYLALWLPFLSADRLWSPPTNGAAAPADAPFVFVEKQRGAMRLAALSPAALALGLAPGMALADAQARAPDLLTLPYDPVADARWLERLADGCERYTPSAAIDPPDALVLDITGCAHLFDGETALIADVTRRLAGLHIRTAVAGAPEAALALARLHAGLVTNEQAAVRALPLAALRLDEAVETALRRAGLTNVAALADRPVAPLAARFGAATVLALDRLLGRSDSRIVPRRAPPALIVERRFAEPIAQLEVALAVLAELTTEAAVELDRRGQGGRRFATRFYRSDGALADLTVETGRPNRDPDIVMRLFRERIEALVDPLDPGFGFDMIRLAVPVLEPLASGQLELDGGSLADDALAALIDRLSARLGRDRVRRFAPRDSHIPEQACFTFQAAAPRPDTVWPTPEPGEPPLRPLQLFDPPQRIEVIAEVPDGPPSRFRWRRTAYAVTRHEGPERIAGEWWRRGGPAPTRDYYRVEDDAGHRFWIFRHGLYGSERATPAWYIHGLFA